MDKENDKIDYGKKEDDKPDDEKINDGKLSGENEEDIKSDDAKQEDGRYDDGKLNEEADEDVQSKASSVPDLENVNKTPAVEKEPNVFTLKYEEENIKHSRLMEGLYFFLNPYHYCSFEFFINVVYFFCF